MHAYRTHTCGALRSTDAGANVRLSGWIHRKRDHGGLLFIDLRDHYGLTQLVLHPETPGFEVVERLRAESVIKVDGEVVLREGSTVNANLPTGEVEVRVLSVEVLSEAAELPMPVFGEQEYPEEIRLSNRFLDLRRERLHKNIVLRSRVIQSIRNRMCAQGFLEYQTPILTASSPEGARDFLVPSRMHPGKFYALPQAPQQFKQLLMVSGFDRYFQIAPCFRDEDLRADRSLEFYQLDVEMSFVTQEDVFQAIEPLMHGLFTEFGDGKPVSPIDGTHVFTNDFGQTMEHKGFERLTFEQSMKWYGSDKPDLRNP
ncbi:MAG: aspartate--tRNA ligase, partial [Brevundimonas diminuta]